MEEEKLKKLFAGFEPGLGSDRDFMRRLETRLEAVEMVKKELATERSRNRKAVAIAGFVGFVAGILCSFAVPWLATQLSRLTLPSSNVLATGIELIPWFAVALTASLFATNTYALAVSLLKR